MGELGLDSCEDPVRSPAPCVGEGDESQAQFSMERAFLSGERGCGELDGDGDAIVGKVCVADNGDVDDKLDVKQCDGCWSFQNGFLESDKMEACEVMENSCSLANDDEVSSEKAENGSGLDFGRQKVEVGHDGASGADEGSDQWLENGPLVRTATKVEEEEHTEFLVTSQLRTLQADGSKNCSPIDTPGLLCDATDGNASTADVLVSPQLTADFSSLDMNDKPSCSLERMTDENRMDDHWSTSEIVQVMPLTSVEVQKEPTVADNCCRLKCTTDGNKEDDQLCTSESVSDAPVKCLAAEIDEMYADTLSPLVLMSDGNGEENPLYSSETAHGMPLDRKVEKEEQMVGDTLSPSEHMNDGCREETLLCAPNSALVTAEKEQTIANASGPLWCINRCTKENHLCTLESTESISLECMAAEQVKTVADFYKTLEIMDDGSREENRFSPPETKQVTSLNCISTPEKQTVESSCSSLKFINGGNRMNQLGTSGTIQDTSLKCMGANREHSVADALGPLQHMADGDRERVQLGSETGQCSIVEPISDGRREVEQLNISEAIRGMYLECMAAHQEQMVTAYSSPLEQIADCNREGVQSCSIQADEGIPLECIVAQKDPIVTDVYSPLENAKVVYEDQLYCPEIAQSMTLECTEEQNKQTALKTCCLLGETGVSLQVVGEGRCQASLVEGEDSTLVQFPTSKVVSSALDSSSLPGSSYVSTSVVDGPSELPLAMGLQCSYADAVGKVSTCHINSADTSVQTSNERRDNTKSSSSLIVFRRNPKRAASMRSSLADVQCNASTRTNNGRKARQAVETPVSLSTGLVNIFSNKVTKKRSSFLKPARVSVWGDAQSLVQIFRQKSELAACDPHTMKVSRRSSRQRSCIDRRKQEKDMKERSTGVSKAKHPASSDPSCTIFHAPTQSAVNTVLLNSDCLFSLSFGKEVCQIGCKSGEDTLDVKVKLLRQNGQHGDKDLESTVTQDISVANIMGDCSGASSQADQESLVDRVDDRHLLEPGNSPDSVVSHTLTDVAILASEGAASTNSEVGLGNCVSTLDQDGVDAAASTSLKLCSTPVSDIARDSQQHSKPLKGKKEKRDAKLLQKDLLCDKRLQVPEIQRKSKKSSNRSKPVCKEKNSLDGRIIKSRKTSRKGSKGKCIPMESSVLRKSELDCCEENQVWSGQGNEKGELIVGLLDDSLPVGKTEGKKLRKYTRVKDRSTYSESSRNRRRNACGRKKVELQKSNNKGKVVQQNEKLDSSVEASGSTNIISVAANKTTLSGSTELTSKTNAASEVALKDVSSSLNTLPGDEVLSRESHHAVEGQFVRPRLAWVLCDDCQKWRCISAALADHIDETNCKWTCKENTDKAFADCSISQEKTNAEINAELDISDASCEEDSVPNFSRRLEPAKRAATERTSWKLIKSNCFLHRNRKTQIIDEIMVCHCKLPSDGSLGCGDECLNRMLNIECIQGMCPCGDLCSNQQFQKRKYAKFKSVRYGKKGYGLELEEHVCKGQFLIEYVGEVLDLAAYEARQRSYASSGQKHFYFMTLNGGEVIDACTKGNQGRFINHSCDPNCRTEKWMVNGEVCIGIFALRDIKQGEEVTFDYNYVRVFGAAAKKCVCGSSICRGYIGGDPLNSEVIDQGDSDEEYLEPLMVQEDTKKAISDINDGKVMRYKEISAQDIEKISKCLSPAPDIHLQAEVSVSLEQSDSKQAESTMTLPLSQKAISSRTAICPDEISSNPVEDKSNKTKLSPLAKLSRPRVVVKNGKSSTKDLVLVPQKAEKVLKHGGNRHFEGVEEKLNELLDAEGGISKRKDATKGYLKLLFVTAAEGDRGCASQSIRDLSLILDALLKTKSRLVLMDIINKNGLQMLHNIMKQNRSNFNRIPIIRKLLKVLEFLALKGILTPEHMSKSPPCSGMESFKESILKLTRHNDMQVHQIARNFRDKWIPRSIKRVELSDRDDSSLDSNRSHCNWFQSSLHKRWKHDQGARDSDAIVCVSEDNHLQIPEVDISPFVASQQISAPATGSDSNPASGAQPRKRKSRWDQPSENISLDQQSSYTSADQVVEAGVKLTKLTHIQREQSSDPVVSKLASEIEREKNSFCDVAASARSSTQENIDDEAPPGFGSCDKQNPHVLSTTSLDAGEAVKGHLQERYLSNLTVCYGMPVALMQQLGTLESGGIELHSKWAVAPGMPFHPFPPLPPYPRGNPGPTAPDQTSSNFKLQECKEEAQVAKGFPIVPPNAAGEKRSREVESGFRHPKIADRVRLQSNDSGKRFFQTQRWNCPKVQRFRPRWPREGNGYRFRGSSSNGGSNLCTENVRDVKNGCCNPEGIFCDNLNYNQQSENN